MILPSLQNHRNPVHGLTILPPALAKGEENQEGEAREAPNLSGFRSLFVLGHRGFLAKPLLQGAKFVLWCPNVQPRSKCWESEDVGVLRLQRLKKLKHLKSKWFWRRETIGNVDI